MPPSEPATPAPRRRVSRAARAAQFLLVLGVLGVLALLYVNGAFPASVPANAPPYDLSPYARALRYVDSRGAVDYAALAKDRAALDTFVASLAGTSPVNHPEQFRDPADALAYWINAYNALTLAALVDRYPLSGVGGPTGLSLRRFSSWPVGGERLTLSAIEQRLSHSADARVVFALHTGARGGPGLLDAPYDPQLLDGQLTEAGRRFMARADALRIRSHEVWLSELLRWNEAELLSALPEGRHGNVLQLVWAFLPDACTERPGCDTRADLDRACGPHLDRCAAHTEPFDWALDDRHPGP